MDVPLSQNEIRTRRRKRLTYIASTAVVLVGLVYGVNRIGRAAPAVPADGLWIDTVREGDISRELHGVGELAPNDDASRWASAEVDGRVERKWSRPPYQRHVSERALKLD